MPLATARNSIGFGWKPYKFSYTSNESALKVLEGFDSAFGLRIRHGAQWIQRINLEAVNGEKTSIERYGLHDGFSLPLPGGVRRIVVEMKTDILNNVGTIRIDVMLVPGMVWAATEGNQHMAGRCAFPSVLHATPAVGHPVLPGGAGNVLLLCEVLRDHYQEDDTVNAFPASGAPIYASRFSGDDGQSWPTPNLYFDGFISSSVAANTAWKIWILAGVLDPLNGDFDWSLYRELNPAGAFGVLPAGITAQGLITCRLENPGTVPIPIPIPPDGFQIWIENTNAVAKTLRGVIGGRTA